MQIIINGRHFEVTELIRNNTAEKIEALFSYYPTLKVSSVRVTMEIEKNHQAKSVYGQLSKNSKWFPKERLLISIKPLMKQLTT